MLTNIEGDVKEVGFIYFIIGLINREKWLLVNFLRVVKSIILFLLYF